MTFWRLFFKEMSLNVLRWGGIWDGGEGDGGYCGHVGEGWED